MNGAPVPIEQLKTPMGPAPARVSAGPRHRVVIRDPLRLILMRVAHMRNPDLDPCILFRSGFGGAAQCGSPCGGKKRAASHKRLHVIAFASVLLPAAVRLTGRSYGRNSRPAEFSRESTASGYRWVGPWPPPFRYTSNAGDLRSYDRTLGIGCSTIARKSEDVSLAVNGDAPVKISNSVTPSAQTSVRMSPCWTRWICSGAM